MDIQKGGRGKKAPYESTHVRIPEPIKDRVEELKRLYISGTLEQHDELVKEDFRKAREYENLLTGSNPKVDSSQNSLPSLEDAQAIAKKLLRQKKSSRETIAKLLTALYGDTVSIDDLKE